MVCSPPLLYAQTSVRVAEKSIRPTEFFPTGNYPRPAGPCPARSPFYADPLPSEGSLGRYAKSMPNSFSRAFPGQAPFHIPIDLPTDTLDYLGFPGTEAVAAEKAADIQHPVIGVLAADEVDFHEGFF